MGTRRVSRQGSRKSTVRRTSSKLTTSPPNDELAVMGGTGTGAPQAPTDIRTVIYIHGIGNKPPASVLKCQWDRALFGTEMGDRTRMAYWVNRAIYPDPAPGTCGSGDTVDVSSEDPALAVRALNDPLHPGGDLVAKEIDALAQNAKQRAMLTKLAAKMRVAELADDAAVRVAATREARLLSVEESGITARDIEARLLPLPAALRKLIFARITRAFLRDAHSYLFDAKRREVMRESLLERLRAGGGPFLIVAHSMGSAIAYDVLRDLAPTDHDIRLLVTFGSPLGVQEMQDFLKGSDGKRKLQVPGIVKRWVNVSDLFDPVALDGDISNDYAPNGAVRIENHLRLLLNPDSPRNPHSATGYLSTRFIRKPVQEESGSAFAQEMARFTLARDLVGDLEDAHPDERHHVLIQLVDPQEARKDPFKPPVVPRPLRVVRDEVEKAIHAMGKEAQVEVLKRFIAAELTREQIETLRTKFARTHVDIVWRDAEKRALILDSTHTIQCRPANESYSANGRDIRWAILDTGVNAQHPHFARYTNIEAQWDCTIRGATKELPANGNSDGHGHGTHVAGILAGAFDPQALAQPATSASTATAKRSSKKARAARSSVPPSSFILQTSSLADPSSFIVHRSSFITGMSPETKLHAYKVLSDDGRGKDSYILKALEHIERMNDDAGRLVIHGINLSLGGPFDPSVYGCGHTPICQELRRLWRQGVLVVVAAGNEGFAVLQTESGAIDANLDLSIGDPANLEECIAVGSVHKTNPHTYGVSFFSSRGPTADGRMKPDLVAPGEKIISASHRPPSSGSDWTKLYVAMSGTSMAAPHVSGVLAAFLSLRREFIGYPDRVKEILLTNCTTLDRDPYIQGRGIPSLMRMVLS